MQIVKNGFTVANTKNRRLGTSDPLPMDGPDYLSIISENHYWIHNQRGYVYSAFLPDIANSGKYKYLLRILPGNECHFRGFSFSVGGGPVKVSLHKTPTVTDDGTPVVPWNCYDDSIRAAETLVFSQPTTTNDGSLREGTLLSGDKRHGGMQGNQTLEWVMESTDYLIQIENKSGATLTDTSFFMFFIEGHH